MCGIAGIFAYRQAAASVDPRELERTCDHMRLRGPDGFGLWLSPDRRLGLGHRRLSIIDLSDTGAQPMVSACNRFAVTFNGEIYNYRALRQRLEAQGRKFFSTSDTEVLLHLYAEKGPEMVRELRGMFAFALWDREERRIFLARDPYGIKPLYYADDGQTIRFASQVKALLAGGAVSRNPDCAGIAGFYLFGAVPEPFTVFGGIKALPAGAFVLVDEKEGPREPSRYFSIAEAYCSAEDAAEGGVADAEAVHAALLDSVRHHLVADVPVGAFLSAGIDSGSLVGLMRDAGQAEIKTVTLGFAEFEGSANDETPLAGEVARLYGTNHTRRLVTRQEFEEDFPKILAAMDQPSINGVNTWFVSKAAHELGLKVAISGCGGDELFGGYPSFHQVPRLFSRMRWSAHVPLPARTFRMAASALIRTRPIIGQTSISQKWAGIMEFGGSIEGAYFLRRGLFMPWELPDIMGKEMAAEGLMRLAPLTGLSEALEPRPRSNFAKLASLESAIYMRNQLLRDTDWASMAHSLEVRVPLCDSVLLQACAPHVLAYSRRLGSCKSLLASSSKVALPQGVTARAKTGFSTPIGHWMKALIANMTDPAHDYGDDRRGAARQRLMSEARRREASQGQINNLGFNAGRSSKFLAGLVAQSAQTLSPAKGYARRQ